jgi:hypothetical protein
LTWVWGQVPAPIDWDFARFNRPNETDQEMLLGPSGWDNHTVPYRGNRMVIFNSGLFHKTDRFHFRTGYGNRRINLTFLFGSRQGAAK